MSDRPWVIVLNGVGSVGKTSTAHAFQQLCAVPFLHVSMDAFIGMMPKKLMGHPDGLLFERGQVDGQPSVVVKSGPVLVRTITGMRRAIAAMADAGNHIVVDDVMIGDSEIAECCSLLSRFELRLVGLFAPLEVLEQRERARGDREIGLARWCFDRVHRGVTYDLELDTGTATPMENAQRIKTAFGID
eukprot:gene6667-6737_t